MAFAAFPEVETMDTAAILDALCRAHIGTANPPSRRYKLGRRVTINQLCRHPKIQMVGRTGHIVSKLLKDGPHPGYDVLLDGETLPWMFLEDELTFGGSR